MRQPVYNFKELLLQMILSCNLTRHMAWIGASPSSVVQTGV